MTFFGGRGGSEGAGFGLRGTAGGDAADAVREEAKGKRGMNAAMVDALLLHNKVRWRDDTKPARRVHIGNVNAGVKAEEFARVLETRIRTLSPEAVPWHYPLDKRGRVDERRAPGTRVIEHLYLNDKGFGFLETTALEDVPAILALNGVRVNGGVTRFRRPKDYDPDNNPLVRDGSYRDVFQRVFTAVLSDEVADSPTKVFVGGVEPRALTKLDLLEIVSSFGALTAFRCETDGAGLCRGFAWMEYAEGESVAAKAIAGLSGYQLRGKPIAAALATPRAEAARTRGERRYTYEVPPEVEPLLKPPQRVLAFSNVLVRGGSREDRAAATEDTLAECDGFGNVLSTHVVDGGAEGAEGAEELDAVRDCLFVEFARVETATIAAHAFHRREYDGRVVECRFFPLTEYQRMFGKGFPPRTVEEKQAAALKMMDYLAGTAGSGTGRLAA